MARRGLAVIGAGMGWGAHALSLRDLAERVEVVGVYSRSKARRAQAAAEHGVPVTADLPGLIADPRVSAVLIITPPDTHLDLVRQAAAAGKHVLVEKPLELDLPRARAVVAAAASASVTLGVVLHYRTRENARRLASLVRTGALGRLVTASASIRWWRTQGYYDQPGRGTLARDGGGVLLTQAIHGLDLFLTLAGPVAEVACFAGTSIAHRMECEDVAGAALRFAGGAIGSLDATTASYPGFPERLELVFEQATALLVGEDLRLFHRDGTEQHFPAGASHGGGADPMAYSHEHHRALLQDFLDALDKGRAPIATGASALHVHELIDALIRSSREGRPIRPG